MKKALLVWGGWDGHEPKQTIECFVPFLQANGFEVEVSPSMDVYKDKAKMSALSLVVPCWTMGSVDGDQERGLLEAIRIGGVGIAGWHGGMCDAFRSNTEYQFMSGGQWVAHPGGILEYDVVVTKAQDPIVKGITKFKMKSEQYYLHTDPSNDVLATTTFAGTENEPWTKGVVMPVVWKRMYGKGRVFYSSLGHVAKDFDVPEAKLIMERGMLWAAK